MRPGIDREAINRQREQEAEAEREKEKLQKQKAAKMASTTNVGGGRTSLLTGDETGLKKTLG